MLDNDLLSILSFLTYVTFSYFHLFSSNGGRMHINFSSQRVMKVINNLEYFANSVASP